MYSQISVMQLLFILLLMTGFFGLSAMVGTRYISYFFLLLMSFCAYQTYDNENKYDRYILYMCIGILLSCLFSRFYNYQQIETQLLLCYPYFSIMSYFIFKKYDVSADDTFKVIKWLSVLALCCYLIQLAVFPRIIFDAAKGDIFEDSFRMRFTCSMGFTLLYFYGFNNYFNERNTAKLLYTLAASIPMLIMGFRSLLGLTVVGTILLAMFCSQQVANYFKYAVFIAILGYGALQVPLVQQKIDEMALRQSEEQNFNNEDYVRVLGMGFYEEYFEKNMIMRVVGGGIPLFTKDGPVDKQNTYSNDMFKADDMGLKWNDLGLLGLSYFIGTPAVLFLIFLCILGMRNCTSIDLQWVRFAIGVTLIGTIITSMELYRNGNLMLLGVLLYYIDTYNKEQSNELVI